MSKKITLKDLEFESRSDMVDFIYYVAGGKNPLQTQAKKMIAKLKRSFAKTIPDGATLKSLWSD